MKTQHENPGKRGCQPIDHSMHLLWKGYYMEAYKVQTTIDT